MTDTSRNKEQWYLKRLVREQRIACLYQRRQWFLLGGVVFVCIAVSLGALLWISPGKSPMPTVATEIVGSDLRAVLEQLRSGVAQQAIARVVPKGLTAERCERELPAVLAVPASPLFLPAVLLAGHFGLASLAPQLRAALPTPDAETNRVLVHTVQQLQPWSDDDLCELLESDAPGVVAAAVAVCAKRPGQPPEKLVQALCGNAPEVRKAALDAIPPTPAEEFAAALASQLDSIPSAQSSEALEALARLVHNKEAERILYDRLADGGDACDKALSALARSGKALARPAVVLAIVSDGSRSVTTRSRALYCLERSGTAVPTATLTSLWPEHPVLDYFAARLLLLEGHPAGVPRLMRALDSSVEDEGSQRIVAQARMGTRQLLAYLTDTSPYGDPAVWREWAGSNPAPKLGALPPPRTDLDAEFAPQ